MDMWTNTLVRSIDNRKCWNHFCSLEKGQSPDYYLFFYSHALRHENLSFHLWTQYRTGDAAHYGLRFNF